MNDMLKSCQQKKNVFYQRIQHLNEKFELSPILLPTDVAVHIFSFITREDLENCKLVCKQWLWLIEYGNKSLQKRQIDAVVLSSYKEFSITVHYRKRIQKHIFKKYFKHGDINPSYVFGSKKNIIYGAPNRFRCGLKISTGVSLREHFKNFGNMHEKSCRQLFHPSIYNTRFRGVTGYSSKLFTPPLFFYERLKWVLRNCDVKHIIFNNFTFTDFFVEKFGEFMPQPFCVEQLTLHCCRLKSIHTEVFHRFLGDIISAEKYFLESLRLALPDHINARLLEKENIKRAKIIYIGHSRSRFNTDLSFNINDNEFIEFVKTILEKPLSDISRIFFGIASSRLTNESIKQYRKISMSTKTEQKCLYDQLLFGENRYLSPVLEALLAASRSQNLNQNDNAAVINNESDNEDYDDDDEDIGGLNDHQIGQFEIRNRNVNDKLPFL